MSRSLVEFNAPLISNGSNKENNQTNNDSVSRLAGNKGSDFKL